MSRDERDTRPKCSECEDPADVKTKEGVLFCARHMLKKLKAKQ